MMICIGCGCSDARACAGGCHWVSTNPPVCSECIGLFDEAEFAEPAFENVTGANDDDPFEAQRLVCAHTQRLYIDQASSYCVACGMQFRDEAA